uniref:Uncharacterized protein n=1 Tax=Rhizophora mucronata TaxID=61149 RepID=A0A2P2P698_RHIMU
MGILWHKILLNSCHLVTRKNFQIFVWYTTTESNYVILVLSRRTRYLKEISD